VSRVLVLAPFALGEEGLARRSAQVAEAGVRADIDYDFRPVKAGPTSFQSPQDWLLLDVAILEAGLTAEADGYDAVVIDTASDSGVDALRSMLDIPVVGPGRASLLFALTMGRSFGVLAQWEPALARIHKSLDEWGLAGHCAGVEHFDTEPDFAGLIGDRRDEVFPRMAAACLRLVDSGAEVIILGSTTMHEAHGYLSEILPVPVINPGPLSYKLVETLLAAGLSHSRRAFPRPLVAKEEMIHVMLDAAAERS
jgi:Asp/Glu/hydantoin racemase